MGSLHFAERAPRLGFRRAPENVYTFPFDLNSLPEDQTRPVRPAEETLWGDIVAPDHSVHGTNTFFISHKLRSADHPPLQLTVVAYDYEDRKVITSQALHVPEAERGATQRSRSKSLKPSIHARSIWK